jgi:predicted amino acid-binding ACT domain protein/DNA-binding Xre family transcriptional regulator
MTPNKEARGYDENRNLENRVMAVSIKASERGLGLLDKARLARGWTKAQPEWSEAAGVAHASLKRLWIRQPIGRDKFIALCEVLDLNWQDIAEIDATHNVPGAVQKMKSLFARTVELDPLLNDETAALDNAAIKTLCRGFMQELFTLIMKATETAHPDKSFYRLTQEIIQKIGTLYESQPHETAAAFILEVKVKDKPGSLHQVTGELAGKKINIHQIHIVQDGGGMATLQIYCQTSNGKPITETEKTEIVVLLERSLKEYVDRADAWELGEPPTVAPSGEPDRATG